MIIGKRNNVHSHLRQIGGTLRFGAKRECLVRSGRSPARIRELVIYHKDIRFPHLCQYLFGKSLFNGAAPLLQLCHNRIVGVKQNISRKSHDDLFRRSRFFGIDLFPLHPLRIRQQFPVSALFFRRLRCVRLFPRLFFLRFDFFRQSRLRLLLRRMFRLLSHILSALLPCCQNRQKKTPRQQNGAKHHCKQRQLVFTPSVFSFLFLIPFICRYCHSHTPRKSHAAASNMLHSFPSSVCPFPLSSNAKCGN